MAPAHFMAPMCDPRRERLFSAARTPPRPRLDALSALVGTMHDDRGVPATKVQDQSLGRGATDKGFRGFT